MCKKCGKKCGKNVHRPKHIIEQLVTTCFFMYFIQAILKGTQLHNFESSESPAGNNHQSFQKAPPAVENGADKQIVGNAEGHLLIFMLIGHVKAGII